MGEITLRQLQYLVAVMDAGSVTEAAQKLHVSPGGISLALSQLESTLDVQLLLRRRGKGVAATPAGSWVYEQAQAMLHTSDEIESVTQVMRGELVGSFRIGCFTTLSPWFVPRVVEHFDKHHHRVHLEIVEDESRLLQERLLEGKLDAAFLYERHLIPAVAATPITTVDVLVALSPHHPLAEQKTIDLTDLQDDNLILLALQPVANYVEGVLSNLGLKPSVRWTSGSVETIRSMVARGLGYTIITGRPYGDHTYDGLPIVYRRIRNEIPGSTVCVAYPAGSKPTEKLRALTMFSVSEFGGDELSALRLR